MATTLIHCPKCNAALLDQVFNRGDFTPCPTCAEPIQVEVFPAMFRRAAVGRGAEAVLIEGEASCFYHPQKKAVLPCEGCGRFLCALCDCEHNGQHLCPACLEAGRTKGKIKSLENSRKRHDSVALMVAILGFVPPIIYLSFISAPVVIFLAIRHWKSPLGLTQRSRSKLVVAAVIAGLQIAAWAALIIVLVSK
jgi:hypothetical protein